MGIVLHPTDAAVAAREARRAGRRVVFTNGCFDVLHIGHVRLLEGAKREGDALFVAVNDDSSVRRLKGVGRPIVPLAERMELLAALAAVDVVFPFSEDTPVEAVRLIRPAVLVKGADYARQEIVGADLVESWGGAVVRFPLVGGWSTSRLLRRIGRLARR